MDGTFGSSNSIINPEEAYNLFFRGLPNNTVIDPGYVGWMRTNKDAKPYLGNVNARGSLYPVLQKQFIQTLAKDATISGAGTGTADKVRIPLYLSPDLVDRTRIEQPFLSLVPRKTAIGRTVDFDYVSAVASGVWLPEGASLDSLTHTKVRSSTTQKYLYNTGFVSGPYEAATRNFFGSGATLAGERMADANAEEVKLCSMGLIRTLADTVLDGSATTDTNSFNGVFNIINTNNTTVIDNATTTALSVPLMRQAIRGSVTNGANKASLLGVCDYATYDDIKVLLQAYLRNNDIMGQLAWGIENIKFEGINIIPDRNISTTTGSKYLAFVDMEQIALHDLQPINYVPLARTSDGNKFDLQTYCTLVMTAPNFCSLIKRIL